ncbi:MAG TPA: NtaA/DmoA family FMN-dependent monooxygenase [Microbacteriaceae bacterium]|nr:NtaA/DmoA family FMN-dependent monooxygenase [Microbacteriaceae bacterium]
MGNQNPFHLGWFTGNGVGMYGWNVPFGQADGREFFKPDFWRDIARMLDRACFDLFIWEDSSYIPNNYGGTHDIYLKNGIFTPKHDPAPYVPLLAEATEHIGIALTIPTSEYPPYLAARLLNTLDHLSDGRVAWNIVTGSNHLSAMNYGHEGHLEHDERYAVADEYVDLVSRLFGSWDADAVVMDKATGTVTDPTKVRPIDYEGRYLRSRGPLNSMPSPQHRPVYIQAGGSNAGRDFAAKHAEVIINNDWSVPVMKSFVDDIHARMAKFGRKPSDVKILFMLNPLIAETQEDADVAYEAMKDAAYRVDPALRLAQMSAKAGIDFSQFDLDAPLPELQTNGHQATLANFLRGGGVGIDRSKTLRELVQTSGRANSSLDIIGTPDAVAAQMGDVMAEVGGDGYLISSPRVTRRYVTEVVDGLVPALQRQGLSRTGFAGTTLRDSLMEF